MNNNIPLTFLTGIMALIPLIILFTLLVFVNMKAYWAGLISLIFAAGAGFLLYQAPIETLLVGAGKGLWDALFILLVLWSALLLYHVVKQGGAFEAIREGIEKISKNYLFLVLVFGWVFASFLQGVAGFGAPIAIVAPLLIGLGVKSIYAVLIPLIAINWAKFFGSLGTSWLATIPLIEMQSESTTILFMALLLWIADLVGGLFIAWWFGKGKGVKEALPAIVVFSLIQGGGQVVVTQFNPILGSFVPSIVALGAIFVLTKWDRYSEPSPIQDESPIMDLESRTEPPKGEQNVAGLSLNEAMLPYYVLTVLSVIGLGIPAISEFLGQFEFSFSFPEVTTRYQYVTEGIDSYSPLSIFTHPGFYLLLSSVFAYFWYKKKGGYDVNENLGKTILTGFLEDSKGTTLSIPLFLMMSQILEHTGQNYALAMGIAKIASPVVYAGLTPWIGVLGAFMTSSSTSSNVLFSPLHQSVVNTMDSLTIEQVIAGHTAGGAVGNAIAPANILVGASTANIENTTEITKQAMYYVLVTTVLITIAAVAMHYLYSY